MEKEPVKSWGNLFIMTTNKEDNRAAGKQYMYCGMESSVPVTYNRKEKTTCLPTEVHALYF